MTKRTHQTDALIAEIDSLRGKLAAARHLAHTMVRGTLIDYTCMSDVRADLHVLQDILKDD